MAKAMRRHPLNFYVFGDIVPEAKNAAPTGISEKRLAGLRLGGTSASAFIKAGCKCTVQFPHRPL